MKTIGDIFKSYRIMKSAEIHRGDYGIEVETESKSPYDYPNMKFWICDRDGSLRNFGVEYIMKVPVSFDEVPLALEEIDVCKKKFKFIENSVSTSVHVHINMLTQTPIQLANFLTAYALVENLLIKYSGPDRLSNLFCLPLVDAEGNVDNIDHIIRNLSALNYKKLTLSPNHCKYASINLAPLTSKGSVEIRTFRGETDTRIIFNWVSIIDDLRRFSQRGGMTPKIIVDMYHEQGAEIINEIFPNTVHHLRGNMTLDEVDALLFTNIAYTAKIAIIKDKWDESFGLPKPKKLTVEKSRAALDQYAMDIFGKGYHDLDRSQMFVVHDRYIRNNPNVRIVEAEGDI